jgi:DNA-binding NtrC family response regulator
MRLLFIANRIESALLAEDFKNAEEDLSELKTFRHVTPFQGLGPYELLQAWFYQRMEKLKEGLACLESLPPERSHGIYGLILKTKIQVMLRLDRFQDAEALFSEAQKIVVDTTPATLLFRRYITSMDLAHMKALESLRKGNYEEAHSYAQRMLSISLKGRPFGGENIAQSLLLNIDLARKQIRSARLLLQLMDPHSNWQLVEWGRLYLLEGNFDLAVDFFKKALASYGPEYLRRRLAFHQTGVSLAGLGEILVRVLSASPEDLKKSKVKLKSSSESNEFPANTYLIGKSPAIQDIQTKLQKFAPLHSTILISGETGSGKEVVAKLLHEMGSHPSEPFIAVNCGAMSDTLIESELFGYEKGAFTGAHASHAGLFVSAGKGTIFLDEISSMSTHLQSALLRVLEDEQIRPVGSNKLSKVHARVIAATNEPLEELVAQKKFRKDLYYRLARLHIPIPPLRERKEDIPLLVHYFLQKLFVGLHYEITPELLDHLTKQNWPGNVRQLRNEIERLVFYAGGSEKLTPDLLKEKIGFDQPQTASAQKDNFSTEDSDELPNEATVGYRSHRHQRILQLLKKRSKITRLEIIRDLGCSPNTATQDLRVLEEQKLIRRIQPNPHPNSTYFVSA